MLEAKKEQNEVIINVTDKGPGIPEHLREKIFDMFYSLENGDRKKQSTGLGLAICRGMIGAHGGNVLALPGPNGIGTTISIRLPLPQPPGKE
jgi:two-component system sensor histidine kinase KdpD